MRKKQDHIRRAASELRRIEHGRPVFLENIEYVPHSSGAKSLLIITRRPHEKDARNIVLRWLVPSRAKRQIRLDHFGTFLANMITGKRSTRDMMQAFAKTFGTDEAAARESCLLFLHSLARRGVIAIIED